MTQLLTRSNFVWNNRLLKKLVYIVVRLEDSLYPLSKSPNGPALLATVRCHVQTVPYTNEIIWLAKSKCWLKSTPPLSHVTKATIVPKSQIDWFPIVLHYDRLRTYSNMSQARGQLFVAESPHGIVWIVQFDGRGPYPFFSHSIPLLIG